MNYLDTQKKVLFFTYKTVLCYFKINKGNIAKYSSHFKKEFIIVSFLRYENTAILNLSHLISSWKLVYFQPPCILAHNKLQHFYNLWIIFQMDHLILFYTNNKLKTFFWKKNLSQVHWLPTPKNSFLRYYYLFYCVCVIIQVLFLLSLLIFYQKERIHKSVTLKVLNLKFIKIYFHKLEKKHIFLHF